MLVRRDLYTKYKTATTEREREEARKAYLDKIGMNRNFRWQFFDNITTGVCHAPVNECTGKEKFYQN